MQAKDIPEKPYYRIGEVAKYLGVETHVLRYWESEFPQLAPVRAASKQRLYRRPDLETAFLIKQLLHEQGYTVKGAKQRLAEQGPDAQEAPQAPEPNLDRSRTLAELKDILKILK